MGHGCGSGKMRRQEIRAWVRGPTLSTTVHANHFGHALMPGLRPLGYSTHKASASDPTGMSCEAQGVELARDGLMYFVGESDVFHGHLSQRVASPDELSDERSHRDNAAIRQVVVVAAHTTLRQQRGRRHAPCATVREEKGASSAPWWHVTYPRSPTITDHRLRALHFGLEWDGRACMRVIGRICARRSSASPGCRRARLRSMATVPGATSINAASRHSAWPAACSRRGSRHPYHERDARRLRMG